MGNLREIIDGKLSVIFEGKDKSGNTFLKVMAPWLQADEPTLNKNKYPKALLQNEVARVQKKIETGGGFLSTADHDSKGSTLIATASHLIEKVWMDKAGRCWCEMKVLPTTQGKNVMELLKGGATLGLSLRGSGTAHPRTGEVQSDFKLRGIDIVANPAYTKGTFDKNAIFESVNFEEEKGDKMGKEISEKAIQTLMRSAYETSMQGTLDKPNYTETFEEWAAGGGEKIVRAMVAVEDGKYPTLEEALLEMAPEVVTQLAVEQQLVTPAQCYTEARIAGIDPAKMAEIINASITEKEQAISTNWSAEERQVIYESARRAGKNIGSIEARQKLLADQPVFEDDKETLFEKEVVARHAQLVEDGDNITTLEDVRKVMRHDRDKKAAEELKQTKIQQIVRENLIAGPAKKF